MCKFMPFLLKVDKSIMKHLSPWWKGNIEPVLNLEIQECHWKYELISVEIHIKITGIGCTVWKWQAKQIWHRSAINSKWPTKCNKLNMLQHSNMAKNTWQGSTHDA